MTAALTWHISRATGLVGWALLMVATIWGLLLASRLLERRPSPSWLLDLHRHLGSLTLILVVIHIGAIWLDDFVDYTALEVAVPFVSDVDTLAIALGVLSLWMLVAVQATSWQRARIGPGLWRRVHLLSAPVLIAASMHGWMIGTDGDHPIVIVLALVLGSEVVLLLGLRLRYGRG